MQGRKALKRAFHFRDRSKNAWLNQICEYKVNTFIWSSSVNNLSFKCSQSVLIFPDVRQCKTFLQLNDEDCQILFDSGVY